MNVDLDELPYLPPETVQEILMSLSVKDILRNCRTSTFFNAICNSEDFWHAYAHERGMTKLQGHTWKESVTKFKTATVPVDLIEEKDHFIQKGFSNKIRYSVGDDNIILSWNSGVPINSQKEMNYLTRPFWPRSIGPVLLDKPSKVSETGQIETMAIIINRDRFFLLEDKIIVKLFNRLVALRKNAEEL